MRALAAALVLVLGCAGSGSYTARSPPTQDQLAACSASNGKASEVLALGPVSACTYDTDCQAVSPLVSGRCGAFANAAAYQQHYGAFEAQTRDCDPIAQIVPICPLERAVCTAGRCAGAPLVVKVDECGKLEQEFGVKAIEGNACTKNEECTMRRGTATSWAFVESTVELEAHLREVCAPITPMLDGTRPLPGESASCIEHHCLSDSSPQYTSFLGPRKVPTAPAFESTCLKEGLRLAFTFRAGETQAWALDFKVRMRVDASGSLNQFEFMDRRLKPDARRAIATWLHGCRAVPARLDGLAVSLMAPFIVRLGDREP